MNNNSGTCFSSVIALASTCIRCSAHVLSIFFAIFFWHACLLADDQSFYPIEERSEIISDKNHLELDVSESEYNIVNLKRKSRRTEIVIRVLGMPLLIDQFSSTCPCFDVSKSTSSGLLFIKLKTSGELGYEGKYLLTFSSSRDLKALKQVEINYTVAYPFEDQVFLGSQMSRDEGVVIFSIQKNYVPMRILEVRAVHPWSEFLKISVNDLDSEVHLTMKLLDSMVFSKNNTIPCRVRYESEDGEICEERLTLKVTSVFACISVVPRELVFKDGLNTAKFLVIGNDSGDGGGLTVEASHLSEGFRIHSEVEANNDVVNRFTIERLRRVGDSVPLVAVPARSGSVFLSVKQLGYSRELVQAVILELDTN